jgi:CHAT domain-containing protein/tetratricopeptide (TPR) repeat protein
MLIQKYLILLLAFLLSVIQPPGRTKDIKQANSKKHKEVIQTNSTIPGLKSINMVYNHLETYRRYIINKEINLNEDTGILGGLPLSQLKNHQRAFLYSLILKKEDKFPEMYDTLRSHLDENPGYLPFYDELIFAANSNQFLAILKDEISKDKKLSGMHLTYLKALINSAEGNYSSALKQYQDVLNKDSTDEGVYFHIYYTFRNLGDYEKADNIIESSIKKFSNDTWYLCEAYSAKGSLRFLSGDYSGAEKSYKKSLLLAKKNEDKQNFAKGMINLAIIEDTKGSIESARNDYKNAIITSSKINDFETEAIALSELGVSYSFTNNLIEAKDAYEKSFKLFKKLNNRSRLSVLCGNLAKVYMNLFNYKSAIDLYNTGLSLAGDNKRAQVLNLTGLGDIYVNLSNYSQALKYYRDAKKIASEIKELSLLVDIRLGLGALNINLNRNNIALDYYLSADSLAEKLDDPYILTDVYHKIGLVYYNLDSLANSKKYFVRSIEIAAKYGNPYTEALASIDLSTLNLRQNNFNKTLQLLGKAKKISTDYEFKYLLGEEYLIAGNLYKKKDDLNKAEDNFKNAFSIGKEINQFNLMIEANYRLARLNELLKRGNAADNYYKKAIALIENVSRPLFTEEKIQISYFGSKRDVYDSYAKFLLKEKRFKDAFNIIDRSRSRNTMQNLNDLKLQSLLSDKDKREKIYDLDWMIHSGIYDKKTVDSLTEVFADFKNSLISKQPLLKKYLNMQEFLTLKEIQQGLKDNENMITTYSTDSITYIFLVSKNTFRTYNVKISRDSLINLAGAISPYFGKMPSSAKSIYNQDLFAFNAMASNELYEILFKKPLVNVPHNEKLIFDPSIELITLPFEFLVTSFNKNQSAYNYADKHYLIFDYDISYSPSAGVYIQQQENKLENDGKILIVGDPKINDKVGGYAERRGLLDEPMGSERNVALMPLKYSLNEVKGISNIIKVDEILTQNEATESNFKKDSPLRGIIHLSTHSFLYNKQPVIFFSNAYDPDNDGFLEASEIVQLKLNSDLVVLSSCSSGLGIIDQSEGVLGMSKAFFEAGSKSVIVSLWEVNDKYTSEFMKLYYTNLSRGMNKSDALRKAKIEFIKDYSPNPYYWAAFILSGNTQKINFNLVSKSNSYTYAIAGLFLILIILSFIYYRIKGRPEPVSNL